MLQTMATVYPGVVGRGQEGVMDEYSVKYSMLLIIKFLKLVNKNQMNILVKLFLMIFFSINLLGILNIFCLKGFEYEQNILCVYQLFH